MSTNFRRAFFLSAAAVMLHFFCSVSFSAGGEVEYQEKFAGSKACKACHPGVYEAWSGSLHAKALILSTEAVTLSEIKQLLKKCDDAAVETGEIRYAVGNHWTRRYVAASGAVLPFLYSLPEKRFAEYFDKNYKSTDFDAECIGCHVTGMISVSPRDKGGRVEARYSEAGVGCEACHGPGGGHCKSGDAKKIINPGRLDEKKAAMPPRQLRTLACQFLTNAGIPLGKKGARIPDALTRAHSAYLARLLLRD